jgi:hypothetical protein
MSSKAVTEHRARRKAEGWKQKAFFLPPEAVKELARRAKAAGISETQVLVGLLTGSAIPSVKTVAEPKPKPPAPKVSVGSLVGLPPGAKLKG